MNQIINNSFIGLNKIGSAFYDFAAGVFIQSALLVILLFFIDLFLRKRVRAIFRYCLWLLVLVKLILPPTLSLPTGIGYWTSDRLPVVSSRAFDVVGFEHTIRPSETSLARHSDDPIEDGPLFIPANSALTPVTWQAVLFVLWLLGILAFLVVLIQRIIFVRGLVAASCPAGDELTNLLEQYCRQIAVRRGIRLRLSDAVPSPAVCGLLRPTVLMPTSLVEKLSSGALRATLIHELAHIKRSDLWVNSVQTFLQVVYFYNPFVWFANSIIRKVCEEAVDETVLVALGGQARDYSNTLIDIGETVFWKADLGLRLIGVAESKKALQWRIRHMLNRPIPKSSKLGALGIAMLLVIAAVLLPMARAEKSENSDMPITSKHEEKTTESLHQAAAKGDIEQVKLLISKGAGVNEKDRSGRTPLHFAAHFGHKAVAEWLLAKGADVNVENRWATPLYRAAAGGYKELAELLLAKGAGVNEALLCAVRLGHLDAAKFLLTKGAEVSTKDWDGRTPLHWASAFCHKDLVDLLIANGAQINAKNNDGHAPLYIAMHSDARNSKPLVELLVAKGASVSATHLFAYMGDLEKIKDSIEAGESVNLQDEAGFTLLHAAAAGGQKEMVAFLIASGAQVNAKDKKNATPLHKAARQDRRDVAEILIANGANIEADDYSQHPLHDAAYNNSKDVAELLIARGANVDAKSGFGSPLHCSVLMRNKEVTELLINKGADVNMKISMARNSSSANVSGGYTPLHHAVWNNDLEMVTLLISKGSDVNVRDITGWTLLHHAVDLNYKDMAELLIANGVHVNARNKADYTPLSMAKENGHTEIVELLRKHGAKE